MHFTKKSSVYTKKILNRILYKRSPMFLQLIECQSNDTYIQLLHLPHFVFTVASWKPHYRNREMLKCSWVKWCEMTRQEFLRNINLNVPANIETQGELRLTSCVVWYYGGLRFCHRFRVILKVNAYAENLTCGEIKFSKWRYLTRAHFNSTPTPQKIVWMKVAGFKVRIFKHTGACRWLNYKLWGLRN